MGKNIENMFSVAGALREANDIVLESLCCSMNYCDIIPILEEMRELAEWLGRELSSETGRFAKPVALYCKNMCAAIERIAASEGISHVVYKCNIAACITEINRLLDLEYNILSSKEAVDKYRKKIVDDLISARESVGNSEYKYRASIVLCAYNKLEYTQAAVESIYRFTDFSKGDVELITIDNGSSDGTREYFYSLPNEKKIEFDHNIIGTMAGPIAAEGRFVVLFSNDVIATPNWLEQLLCLLEQNPDVAQVVPTCNEESISRRQGVKTDYENKLENAGRAVEFARKYNRQDCRLWEERSLLMPFLGIYPALLFKYHFIDASYTQLEFVDDDLSTSFRRAGWKMILAKDTFLHHFGGVTLNEGRRATQNNSLINMRKVYYDKWGVDAWESVGDLPGAELAFRWYKIKNDDRLLVVEPRFGAQFLEIKNMYRREGVRLGETTALVADKRYLPDAVPMFDKVVSEKSIEESIQTLDGAYNLIVIGVSLNQLPVNEYVGFLRGLHEKLVPGGSVIVPIENYAGGHYARELADGAGFQGEYSSDDFACRPVKVFSVGRLVKGICHAKGMEEYHLYGINYAEDMDDNKRWTEFATEGKTEQEIDSLKRVCSWRMMYLVIMKK